MSPAHDTERMDAVLAAIIRTYVDTAAPVGSHAICERYRLGISPATVRSVMAQLEAEELITHPHTSAGRLPTDKGYRRYVDSVVRHERRRTHAMARVVDAIQQDFTTMEDLLQRVSEVLSEVTHHLGVTVAPELQSDRFKRLQLVPVERSRVAVVLVTIDGACRSHVIDLGEVIGESEREVVLRFLNTELPGIALNDIEDYLTRKLLAQRDAFFYLLKRALQIVHGTLAHCQSRLRCEGLRYLLEEPEFQNVTHVRELVRLLEDRSGADQLLPDDRSLHGVRVAIGSEHPSEAMRACSAVSANYSIGSRAVGRLGVIGPKRMAYALVIPLVESVSTLVSDMLGGAYHWTDEGHLDERPR